MKQSAAFSQGKFTEKRRCYCVKKLFCAVLMCACVLCTGMAVPAEIKQESTPTGDQLITKIYELSPEEDPKSLIEEDFEQDGFLFQYRDMTKEDVSHMESKTVTQTVTVESQNEDTEENLDLLEGAIPYDSDGFSGSLTLVPSSVKTEAAGYETRSYTVSDTRTYADLAYNDPSAIPQTVQKNGLTLRLSGVTWQGQGGTGANGSLIPTSYTATASYSGTGSTRYATGYLTTADYSGVVTKDEIEKVIYTVSYSGSPIEEPEPEQEPFPIWIPMYAGGALAAGVGITLVVIKIRKRRKMSL